MSWIKSVIVIDDKFSITITNKHLEFKAYYSRYYKDATSISETFKFITMFQSDHTFSLNLIGIFDIENQRKFYSTINYDLQTLYSYDLINPSHTIVPIAIAGSVIYNDSFTVGFSKVFKIPSDALLMLKSEQDNNKFLYARPWKRDQDLINTTNHIKFEFIGDCLCWSAV